MSGDHDFCRALLRETMISVKEHTTAEQRKGAWAYKYRDSQSAEFQITEGELKGFYWNGRACCAWHARAQGWNAWMEQNVHGD